MNNAVLEKTIERVTKHRNVKLVATERRGNYLVSEPNYHTTNFSIANFLPREMRKTLLIILLINL